LKSIFGSETKMGKGRDSYLTAAGLWIWYRTKPSDFLD